MSLFAALSSLVNRIGHEFKSLSLVARSGSYNDLTDKPIPVAYPIQIAASDMSTPLAITSRAAYIRATNSCSFTKVRASLASTSTSGKVQIDVKINGSSILSVPLTIDPFKLTSVSSTVPVQISNGQVTDDDEISIDIIQPGTSAKGLIVSLIA